MALIARKGHAASVRRQSRQRLRSDRRYRRNWCAPFSRRPVRIVCAAPGEACLAPTMAGVGQQCLPEIAPQGHFLALRAQGATAPLGPRNDKSESFTPQNAYRKSCQSAWRSASAATDAIGAYRFHGGLYGSGVRRREGHAPPLQRITGSYGKNSTFHSQFSPSGERLCPNRYLQ